VTREVKHTVKAYSTGWSNYYYYYYYYYYYCPKHREVNQNPCQATKFQI